ncbi:MAG: hypothetical protein C4522_05440 [Desulfobacteraceae bacterium]|nr:MAG: hypothetical protein C4522_05440 [Desulfobacteraceae bacterium]
MAIPKYRSGKSARKTFGLEILPQPNDTTCGPTCLHAVYNYYKQNIGLEQVIHEVPTLEHGGTLAVSLACHALKYGYQATIYSYNLTLFDPTWFGLSPMALHDKLNKQLKHKKQAKLRVATHAYLEFLENGGRLRFQDLTSALIRKYLKRSIPIITGLSATYLYQSAREYGIHCDYDDLRGEPSGHFVVLYGYDRNKYTVKIADPMTPNPYAPTNKYEVKMPRLICSILLGVLTYDAKLLIIEPKRSNPKGR